MHHIDKLVMLRWAYLTLREAAAGVDGETWRRYGENLEANLQDLTERLKQGAYRGKPVRRVYIPKADGRQTLLTRKVNWVLDVDIQNFCGAISHKGLVKFLEHVDCSLVARLAPTPSTR